MRRPACRKPIVGTIINPLAMWILPLLFNIAAMPLETDGRARIRGCASISMAGLACFGEMLETSAPREAAESPKARARRRMVRILFIWGSG